MLKNFRDKIAFSGISVLTVGIILLIFAFITAYGFLTAGLSIISSQDLVQTFGEVLAPLIANCARGMYLGVMVWVGSIITLRGVTIITHAPQTALETPQPPMLAESKPQPQPQPEPRPQAHPQPQQQPQESKVEKPQKERPKEEEPKEADKLPEPEIVVIPPEEVAQPQTQQNPPQKSS